MTYGFVIVRDAGALRQTNLQDRLDGLLTLLEVLPPPPRLDSTPQITRCIRRGNGFALDASLPGFQASLSFDPGPPVSGNYTITVPLSRRNEQGIVTSVTPMDERNRYNAIYSAIARAERGFAITTNPISGGRSPSLWLIGISGWEDTPEAL
jgi:hypothetical protein